MTNRLYDVWRVNEENGLEYIKTIQQSDVIILFDSAKNKGLKFKLRALKDGESHWIFSMSREVN